VLKRVWLSIPRLPEHTKGRVLRIEGRNPLRLGEEECNYSYYGGTLCFRFSMESLAITFLAAALIPSCPQTDNFIYRISVPVLVRYA
jgi:hypothetical protein